MIFEFHRFSTKARILNLRIVRFVNQKCFIGLQILNKNGRKFVKFKTEN